jgi:NAD(P)-dependent dehydrogenase (short-subunit alcohol dehydrogenase family)
MDGKVAVVTGGASGIGRAAVEALAERGASVVIGDVDARAGQETVAAVRDAGGTAEFIATDVTDEAQIRAMVDLAVERFGGLDYAFNNAGAIAVTKPVHEITDEDVQTVMGVNFVGTLLCMRHEIPRMLERGGGAIVNTSSTAAVRGNPGWGIYAASKAANLHLTRVAAAECGPQNIRVNAVLPGPIDTPLFRVEADRTPGWTEKAAGGTAVRRMGMPSEVGAAVAWLCSDEASFVTGLAMHVDGGSALR